MSIEVTRVHFVPNKVGLDYTLKNPYGTTGMFLRDKAGKVLAAARLQVGVKTGLLKLSLHYTLERASTGQTLRIGSPLNYAAAHHEGTRPHRISGRNGGMLRFTQGTRVVYTRAVMHPGTRPNKYLADNLYIVFS